MMNAKSILALLAAAAVCAGCGPSSASSPPPTASALGEPTQAQPKLSTMNIYVGTVPMAAEIARTPEQQQTGMMFRTNRLEETAGMLFPLPYTTQARFWMKNCPVPLSAAYIDADGIIQEIHRLDANNTNEVVSGSENIRFVLETAEGWFDRHHIKPGVAVATERGPLLQTFFGTR